MAIKEIIRDSDTTLTDICDKLNEVIRQLSRDEAAIIRLHEIGKQLCAPLSKTLDKQTKVG